MPMAMWSWLVALPAFVVIPGQEDRPSAVIDRLRACAPTPASAPVALKDTSVRETFSFGLPESCRPDSDAWFVHGGNRWRCGDVTIEVVRGIWGPSSFENGDAACASYVAGTPVMVVRDPSHLASVTVWYPTDEAHEPLLSAFSTRPEDRPLVEAIAFSGKVRRPR